MTLRPLLAASAVFLIALPARAEPRPDAATLTYLPSRATVALCPAANFFVLEVQIRLGYALFQPSAPNHLTVKVERANGLFRSTGEMRDDSGKVIFTRDYSEIDCGTVLVSMAISVALEFTKLPEDPEPSPPAPLPPAPTPPAPLPPVSPPPPLPPKLPALALAERPRLQAGLASVFSIGAAPVVVGGVAGFVGVRRGSYSLALDGSALFAPSATIENYSPLAGYHYLVAAIAGSGCYHVRWAFGCVHTELGLLSTGNSKLQFTSERIVSFGVGLRFGGEWALTPGFALRAYSEFSIRPVPGVLREDTKDTILWPGSVLSGSIGFGPAFSFSTL
jgi:hypothetical protein